MVYIIDVTLLKPGLAISDSERSWIEVNRKFVPVLKCWWGFLFFHSEKPIQFWNFYLLELPNEKRENQKYDKLLNTVAFKNGVGIIYFSKIDLE